MLLRNGSRLTGMASIISRFSTWRSWPVGDVVWSCPDCDSDLIDHRTMFYCPGCGGHFTVPQVMAMMTDDERIA
jgi:hypothetical protein